MFSAALKMKNINNLHLQSLDFLSTIIRYLLIFIHHEFDFCVSCVFNWILMFWLWLCYFKLFLVYHQFWEYTTLILYCVKCNNNESSDTVYAQLAANQIIQCLAQCWFGCEWWQILALLMWSIFTESKICFLKILI